MQTTKIPYPFVREKVRLFDEDGPRDAITWRPGTRYEAYCEDDSYCIADGLGFQIVTEVSRHQPAPKYPERVFYTREWEDPAGRRFGKPGLHIKTAHAFKRLCGGFAYKFILNGDDLARKAWRKGYR